MYIGLHVKYPLILPDFNEPRVSRHIFEKFLNMKFYENPSSERQVVSCGRTDMTKLIVAFRGITDMPKKMSSFCLAK